MFSLIITASAGSGEEIIIAADTSISKTRLLDHERAEKAVKMAHALYENNLVDYKIAASSAKMGEGFGRDFIGDSGFSNKLALHFAILFNNNMPLDALTKDLALKENILVFSSEIDLKKVNIRALKDFLLVLAEGNNNYVYAAKRDLEVGSSLKEFILSPSFYECATSRFDNGITYYQLSIGDVVSKGKLVEFKTWTPEKLKDITSVEVEKKYQNELSVHLYNQVIVSQGNNSFGYFKAPFEKDFAPLSLDFNKEKADFSQGFLDFQVKRRHFLQEASKDSFYKVNVFNRFANSHFIKLLLK